MRGKRLKKIKNTDDQGMANMIVAADIIDFHCILAHCLHRNIVVAIYSPFWAQDTVKALRARMG
jgi:hypothetical protein